MLPNMLEYTFFGDTRYLLLKVSQSTFPYFREHCNKNIKTYLSLSKTSGLSEISLYSWLHRHPPSLGLCPSLYGNSIAIVVMETVTVTMEMKINTTFEGIFTIVRPAMKQKLILKGLVKDVTTIYATIPV